MDERDNKSKEDGIRKINIGNLNEKKSEIEKLNAEIERLQNIQKSFTQDITKLRNMHGELKISYEKAYGQNRNLVFEINTYKKQLDILKSEVSSLEGNIRSNSQMLNFINTDLEENKAKNKILLEENKTLTSTNNNLEETNNKLVKDNEKLINLIDNNNKKLEDLKNNITNRANTLEDLDNKVSTKESILKELSVKEIETREDIQKLENIRTSLYKEVESTNDKKLSLQQEVNQLNTKNKELTKIISDNMIKSSNLSEEITKNEEILGNLKSEIKESQANLKIIQDKVLSIDNLETKINIISGCIGKVATKDDVAAIDDINRDIKNVVTKDFIQDIKLPEIKANLDVVNEQVNLLDAKNNELRNILDKIYLEKSQYFNRCKHLQTDIYRLRYDLEAERDKNEDYLREIKTLHNLLTTQNGNWMCADRNEQLQKDLLIECYKKMGMPGISAGRKLEHPFNFTMDYHEFLMTYNYSSEALDILLDCLKAHAINAQLYSKELYTVLKNTELRYINNFIEKDIVVAKNTKYDNIYIYNFRDSIGSRDFEDSVGRLNRNMQETLFRVLPKISRKYMRESLKSLGVPEFILNATDSNKLDLNADQYLHLLLNGLCFLIADDDTVDVLSKKLNNSKYWNYFLQLNMFKQKTDVLEYTNLLDTILVKKNLDRDSGIEVFDDLNLLEYDLGYRLEKILVIVQLYTGSGEFKAVTSKIEPSDDMSSKVIIDNIRFSDKANGLDKNKGLSSDEYFAESKYIPTLLIQKGGI